MEARILGHEDAVPALDLVWSSPLLVGSSVTYRPLSFVFLDMTGPWKAANC